ncbi:DExH-box ATP-dependent RNA helicase DExH4, chloroplastic [Vitis vinifera]|uniref:DExH-box ATP-dependent RNA helicase DExH4, chloroplastic n=1 Tax=Vitis vinifera TaxID=29760 RepID=A0A438GFJ8_VITVI|nr:DExH-box ATP-dependent RNA helicase DExH4, chloroplastic [Vitis vinifera]
MSEVRLGSTEIQQSAWKRNGFCYAVSVLRKSTGRGKSRKAGGLTTLELPDQLEAFESAEVMCSSLIAYLFLQFIESSCKPKKGLIVVIVVKGAPRCEVTRSRLVCASPEVRCNSFTKARLKVQKACAQAKRLEFEKFDLDLVSDAQEGCSECGCSICFYQLFPDLPIHLAITEPYALFVIQWKEGESSIRIEDSEEDRRAGFVNSILDAGDSGSTAFVDVTDNSLPKKFQMPQIEENRNLNAAGPDLKPGRVGNFKEAESSYLKQEYENKMKIGNIRLVFLVFIPLRNTSVVGNLGDWGQVKRLNVIRFASEKYGEVLRHPAVGWWTPSASFLGLRALCGLLNCSKSLFFLTRASKEDGIVCKLQMGHLTPISTYLEALQQTSFLSFQQHSTQHICSIVNRKGDKGSPCLNL